MPAPRIAAHMIENVSWETFRGRSAATMPPSRLTTAIASAFVTSRRARTISANAVMPRPPVEDAFATAGAHAFHFRQADPMLRLGLQELREDPAKAVARLHVATRHRLDRAAHPRARVREGNVLRPAPLEDHFLAELERIFTEGQVLRDFLGEDHALSEEEAVARV